MMVEASWLATLCDEVAAAEDEAVSDAFADAVADGVPAACPAVAAGVAVGEWAVVAERLADGFRPAASAVPFPVRRASTTAPAITSATTTSPATRERGPAPGRNLPADRAGRSRAGFGGVRGADPPLSDADAPTAACTDSGPDSSAATAAAGITTTPASSSTPGSPSEASTVSSARCTWGIVGRR